MRLITNFQSYLHNLMTEKSTATRPLLDKAGAEEKKKPAVKERTQEEKDEAFRFIMNYAKQ